MITFKWTILELFADEDKLSAVKYLLIGTDGNNNVETEGKHTFSDGVVNKTLSNIVESDIVQWLEKDTINLIKLAIENQIKNLEAEQKVDFPWLANTFTIE
jgi:hypothetical protein